MKSFFPPPSISAMRIRTRLVERLKQQGITNPSILSVIEKTPRHLFVDEALSQRAYEDTALPIGRNQTISQPYVVAKMTEILLDTNSVDKVLEIGTGCAYQTAILCQLVERVFTVERIQTLQNQSKALLQSLAIRNVVFRWGDGWEGWPAYGPYEAILVTAAAPSVPTALLDQLTLNGRLVMPLGGGDTQDLVLIERTQLGFTQKNIETVRFVPLLSGATE